MSRWRRGMVLASVAALGFVGPAAATDEKAEPPVQYRMAVMHGMGENAAAIGLIMRAKLPQSQNMALHAEIIAASARAAVSAFKPKVPGGAAKNNIWEKWDDFSVRLTKLAGAADELAVAARTSPDAVGKKLDPVFAACKDCHDEYKRK